ncbi:hypothetical protein H7I41_28500 [Mycobacterium manitobense]|uniref:Uncharacterized protein n=1 Tax=[Mycobacterium] manitobense TaxID=190147 RepID=A0A9X2YVP6_9MYCO|nr:hypothetical protein [[Mycobacterium] manitobense]MCV7173869.1 hypothetical protein [[Mycobacterium] manitobense]
MGRIFAAIAAVLVIAGCGGPDRPPKSTTVSYGAPLVTEPAIEQPVTTVSPAANCTEAPTAIVDMINAAFTDGEQLEHTQAVNAPDATTYVGGNIFGADGTKASSQDTWLVSNGAVFAITSDARRRTLLPDGRDIDPAWGQYNAAVYQCVGQVERAANPGR